MYYGRYVLGEVLPVLALADAEGGVRAQPTAPASVSVYDSAGALVVSSLSPSFDPGRAQGLFRLQVLLDGRFSAGRYMVRVSWADGSYCRQECGCFDVMAGGNAQGHVISQRFVYRPGGDSIVRKTSAGKRFIGRRPTP